MPTKLGEAKRLNLDTLPPEENSRRLHRFVEEIIAGYDPVGQVQVFPQAVLGSRGVLDIVDSYRPPAQLPGHPKLESSLIPGSETAYLPGELDATHPYAAILGDWSKENLTVQQFNARANGGGMSHIQTLNRVRSAWLTKLGISEVYTGIGSDVRITFEDGSVLLVPRSGVYDGGGNRYLPLSSKAMAEVVYAGILAKRHLGDYIPLNDGDYVYGEVETGLDKVRNRHFFALEREGKKWSLHTNSYTLTERLDRDLGRIILPEEIQELQSPRYRGFPRYSGMQLLNILASRRVGEHKIPQRDLFMGRNNGQLLIDVDSKSRESVVRGMLSELVGMTVRFADTADSATPS